MLYECIECGVINYARLSSSGIGNYAIKDGHKICYECAAKSVKDDMVSTGKACLYYDDAKQIVVDFTGLLSFKVLNSRTSHHNRAGVRYDYWFIFNGYVWHGYTVGYRTMVAHCKQTKEVV
jgi:hypothetical protein